MPDYHFDITPHIVKQLGEQLVSDEITALLELIKNSYDADASYVSIEINTSGQYLKDEVFFPNRKGFISVEDDGFGMSEQTILKSWLVISYSAKRALKAANKKTPKGRTPLGDKGLGRLSTQRLADVCEIYTREEGEQGIHLGFNWKDFETEEALSKVTIQSKPYTFERKKGTTLVLSNIKHSEVWEGKNLEKFKGQVSKIISPFKDNRPFEVFININGVTIDLDKSNENLRDLAISRFDFEHKNSFIIVKGKTKLSKFIGNNPDDYKHFLEADKGKKFYEFLSKKYPDIKFESSSNFFLSFERKFDIESIGGIEVFDGKRADPGSFSGQIDEFTFDQRLSEDEGVKEIFGKLSNYREFAQNQSGVKIFRNGFAVIPYGVVEGNDWLNLRESQTKTSFYDLRPGNVIGFFSIDEGINKNLKDKTDRQGIDSNPYSRNFFTMAFFIRDEINRYQRSIRRAYDDYLRTYKTANSGIKTVSQAFSELKDTKAKTAEVKDEFKGAKSTVDKAIKDSTTIVKQVEGDPMFSTELEKETSIKIKNLLEELKIIQSTFLKLEAVVEKTDALNDVINILEPKIQILEEQLSNFSELASLGLVAESVSHEFASIADRLAEKSSFYSNKLQNKKLEESDVFVLMEYINSTVNGLKIQLKHLDPALKYNKEKRDSFSLKKFLNDEKEYYSSRFKKSDIEFIVEVVDDFNVKINRGKLTQVIDNILNNSEYWLKQKKLSERNFNPSIKIKVEEPWLYLMDNGFGVPPAIENQIFEPFVTTKPTGEGRGLGLFIVQQLLDSAGCTIAMDLAKNENGRKYIFAINLSNIKE